jgi:FixJ family two-component response regulator
MRYAPPRPGADGSGSKQYLSDGQCTGDWVAKGHPVLARIRTSVPAFAHSVGPAKGCARRSIRKASIPDRGCSSRRRIPNRRSFQRTQTSHRQESSHTFSLDACAEPDKIVHVVSDDAARVRTLAAFFSSHSIRINAARSPREFTRNARPDQTTCVILDLNLPDCNGIELQIGLADTGGPPVIFVTANGDLVSGVLAMKNGAIDFMVEPVDYNQLLVAVENAFAQDSKNRQERLSGLSLLIRWDSLTPREQDAFRYTVEGFLNKQAAAELGITENTFQVHRGRVMRKMKANSLADLVRMSTRLESLVHSREKQRNHNTISADLLLKVQARDLGHPTR